MREILFRGKRKDNGEWIYGSLSIEYDKSTFISFWVLECTDASVNLWEPKNEYYEVIQGSVGQYIGLSDKNGLKIYSGDIIMGAFASNLLVGFNTESASFGACLNTSMDIIKTYWFNNDIIIDKDQWVVIGNIHDNPELLNPIK